jgi:hypothetical protein
MDVSEYMVMIRSLSHEKRKRLVEIIELLIDE